LELTAATTGFLMEFDLSFYQPKNRITEHRWKKASSKNYCEVEDARFTKLHTHLATIFEEYTSKQDGYKSIRVTPAMQAGLTKRVMSIEDIVNLVPEAKATKRGSYKKKGV
jgi:hypothetical protein